MVSELRKLTIQFAFTMLLLAYVSTAQRASASHANRTTPEGTEIARTALAPYLTARTYRGTRTLTVTNSKDHSEITYTVSLQARCNETGIVDRYRMQTLCWGRQQDKDVDESGNATSVMDGKTLWTMHPVIERYNRTAAEQIQFPTLLGLPSPDLPWRLLARKHDDPAEERLVHAIQGKVEWTLVTDTTSGRLLRIETEDATHGPRVMSISVLKDIAFDAELPDSHFTFTPPSWMSEDKTAIAKMTP